LSSIPIGYLIPALLVLLSVYFVVAPPAWSRPFRFWWVMAAVVNELPLFAALFLVASTALAISEGDIYTPGGWIAFGLHVAANAILEDCQAQATKAKTVVSRSNRTMVPLVRTIPVLQPPSRLHNMR
jgi:hypothetical protein